MKKILIPKLLISDLEEAIVEYNGEIYGGLKIDVAFYFVSLLFSIPTYYRETNNVTESVRLSSKRLKSVNYKYSEYLQFLMKYGFIEKINNYSTNNKTCNSYVIGDLYSGSELIAYEITDKFLLRRFHRNGHSEAQFEKMEHVLEIRPYLVASFNDNLSINTVAAKEEVFLYLEDNYYKYQSASQLLLEWENKEWSYSVKPKSDNRIHSTMTRTNKILRKHISYNGISLGEVDIKTSQPFFLMAILNGVLRGDKSYLRDLGVMNVLEEEVLCNLLNLDLCADNIALFTDVILNGDLYKELVDCIPVVYEDNKPFRMVWPNGQYGVPKIPKFYDNERDLMKEIVLEVLNGSVKSRKTEVVAFKKLFPCIDMFLNCLSDNGVKVFNLLSNIEAYCLLDITGEYIANKHEGIPLFSIHDSLVSTENYLLTIKSEMEIVLEDITGYKPNLKVECWGRSHSLLQNESLISHQKYISS
ncbi:hypothetical protein [Maribacter litoralis]|uniref:hypothetical protein n=1 Tax=Maribacter litoralis TaxID=2059726 RepID=UPI003D2CC822